MSLEKCNDESLIGHIRDHREEALQELMRRYYTPLGDYAFSLLRRRDLAEEAVSNVLIAIWRRRESLTVRGNVRSYLFAAVGNQAFSLRKSEQSPSTVWLDDELTRTLADTQMQDTDIIYRDLQREIEELIRRMPAQRQTVFRMNRMDGLRYWQIAETLGIAESTVQNHMVQAVKQLAQELPRLRSTLTRNPFGD